MENLMIAAIERGFGWNFVRNIFGTLDSVAFWLFSKVMGLMFDIANLTAQKGDAITSFLEPLQGRIYVILSIYMVFKVTISLLTYIVNPDSMVDKNQGIGKLVQRIVISLAILSFFPYGFKMLNKLQADLISNETIPKLVLGVSGSVDSPEGIGTEIAYEIYNGTFLYEESSGDDESGGKSGGKISTSPETVDALIEHINDPKEGDNSAYKYGYIPFVGFAFGILMSVLTLSMCVDVSIRVFKLIILQMVAPIPIISYMDPKQAKDGAFSKWLKLTIKVWAEVFIRLFVIYFILLVIEELIGNGGELVSDTNFFVKIALVIGLLFFAKDAPKFICEAIGIKDVPKGGLFGGLGSIMAAGAIGAGVVSGAIAGYSASKLADEANMQQPNKAKNIGALLFGGVGGLATGIGAAAKAKDHNARAVMEAMSKRNDAAIAAGAAGSTALGRAMSMGSRILTGQTSAMRMDRSIAAKTKEINDLKAKQGALSNIKSRVSGEMVKSRDTKGSLGIKTDNFGETIGDVNYKDFMSRMNAAKTAGQDYVDFYNVDGDARQISMVDAENLHGLLLKNNEDDYLRQVIAGTIGDSVLTNQIAEAAAYELSVTDRNSVNGTIDSLNGQIATATREKAAMEELNQTNKQNDRFAGKK